LDDLAPMQPVPHAGIDLVLASLVPTRQERTSTRNFAPESQASSLVQYQLAMSSRKLVRAPPLEGVRPGAEASISRSRRRTPEGSRCLKQPALA
jgi:hypothetical protein